jgi:putative peptide zinc metalloprotease protein
LLAYVLELQRLTVRAVVAQDAVDLIRHRRHGIEVRLAEDLAETRPAILRREVPGASEALPSPALGSAGGGKVVVDPRDARGATAAGKVFQVDLELPSRSGLVDVGGRVYVRFDHGRLPLAQQWYLHLRQIFLARFDV